MPWYETRCDRPEAAADLFRQATELDPVNGEAWRGWGLAVEQQDGCFNMANMNWIGRGPEQEEKSHWRKSYEMNWTRLGTLTEAEPKFRQATEVSPENHRAQADWGANLIRQAAVTDDQAARRELVRKGSEKYHLAIELKADDSEIYYQWGRHIFDVLVFETDQTEWFKLLAEARRLMEKSAELTPYKREDEKSFYPKTQIYIWDDYVSILRGISYEKEVDRKRTRHLRDAALKAQQRLVELSPESADKIYGLSIRYLDMAEASDNEKEWRDFLKKAVDTFERAMKMPKPDDDDGYTFFFFPGNWTDAAMATDDRKKREAIVQEIISLYQKAGPEDWHSIEALGLLRLSTFYWPDQDTPRKKYEEMLFAAKDLPQSVKRDELRAAGLLALSEAVEKETGEEKARLLFLWGDALLDLSENVKDPAEFQKIITEAGEKFALSLPFTNNPRLMWEQIAFDYKGLPIRVNLENPEHQRLVMAKAIEAYEKSLAIEVNAKALESLADIYKKLAQLETKGSEQKMILENKARLNLDRAVDLKNKDAARKTSGLTSEDTLIMCYTFGDCHQPGDFGKALTLIRDYQSERKKNRNIHAGLELINEAMVIFRRHFLGQSLRLRRDMDFTSDYGHELRLENTRYAAKELRKLYDAYYPGTMGGRSLLLIATLHRQMAASGMFTEEYRQIFWKRSEVMLRRVLSVSSEYLSGIAEKKRSNRQYEIEFVEQLHSLATSELALVLVERSFLGGGDVKSSTEQATALWKEAEELRPGSSRYAQARWAAWQGDLEGMKKFLADETRLVPSLEAAKYDPALAAYVHEPWFRSFWYGFDQK